MAQVHAILITHTARHLRRVLMGAVHQSRQADAVVLSTDSDDPEIAAIAGAASQEARRDVIVVQRPHQGRSRSAQVRNNAVRVLKALLPSPSSRLVFLDGDCVPSREAFAQHELLGGSGPPTLVLGFRIDLTPDQTDAFSLDDMLRGHAPVHLLPEQLKRLEERHARYRRAASLRRWGLTKRHKPKLLGANFSIPLQTYIDINGFDECYEGYGQEDDDFGLRCYLAGATPVIGIADIMVFHQYHPTRAPTAWSDSPGVKRLAAVRSPRCERGLENPLPQPEPSVTRFECGQACPIS